MLGARTVGLLLGVAADVVFADPARRHPVAGFGRLAARLEQRCYADSRLAGLGYAALTVGAVLALGQLLARVVRGHPTGAALTVGIATWSVLGGTSLSREGAALGAALDAGDLGAARARIGHLCGRDPQALDGVGLARAGCESVAENTSDAVVAPLLWGALAGVPGLLGYRAVNTLDAMVGYRSPRYARFGWAAARADDLANLVPARLTAALTVALAPLLGGSARGAARAWWRDASGHPSPNAGPVEAAAAGALGVRLGGPTRYPHGVEQRPVLGGGDPPTPDTLRRMVRLSRLLGWAATLVAALLAELVTRATGQKRDLP